MPTQTALITGASSGIGKEIAILLAKHGYNLILTARNAEMLQETANACKTHNIAVEAILADLAQESAPRQIVDEINAKNLQVDILVNNAGFGSIGRFTELELSRELEMVKVNVLALMSLTRLLLPRMLERQSGRILNVASMAGFVSWTVDGDLLRDQVVCGVRTHWRCVRNCEKKASRSRSSARDRCTPTSPKTPIFNAPSSSPRPAPRQWKWSRGTALMDV